MRGIICHKDTIVKGERYCFKVHKSDDFGADEVHLSAFVKCGGKSVVIRVDSCGFERASGESASEVDVVYANGTDVLR